jgi:t-SNARE complex subunit (syntaxin)
LAYVAGQHRGLTLAPSRLLCACVMAQEWEETKARQDQQLENIETGLGHLKEIGGAMNEELQRHDILLNEVDEKMDKVTKELQTNNMRLKGLVTKTRSTRNFIVDVVLICVVLAIGLYLFNFLR